MLQAAATMWGEGKGQLQGLGFAVQIYLHLMGRMLSPGGFIKRYSKPLRPKHHQIHNVRDGNPASQLLDGEV